MERLTKRGNDNVVRYKKDDILWELCEIPSFRDVKTIIDRLAYYEDMEEQGRLVVLPCKVGDTVWMIVTKRPKVNMPEYSFVKRSHLTWFNMERVLRCFGKTVFLTREEAEKALAADKNVGRKNGGAE